MKKNLTEHKFGKLTVLREAKFRGKKGRFRWLCKCECGRFCYAFSNNLTEGQKKSCGCQHRRGMANGISNSSTYGSWYAMIQRCDNPKHPYYEQYGGSGIVVDDKWYDFSVFLSDMGEKPSDEYTIERVDSHKDYTAENCVWGNPNSASS